MIFPKTELRLKKLLSKHGFLSTDFDFKAPEDKGKNVIRFALKEDTRYSFEWRWHKNPTGPNWKTNVAHWPFHSFQPNDLPLREESQVIDFGEKQFDIWLHNVREELEAIKEINFIDNPFFESIPEAEMDKPFTPFEKTIYLKGLDVLVDKINRSNISLDKKNALLEATRQSREELEGPRTEEQLGIVEEPTPSDCQPETKRSWISRLGKRLAKVLLVGTVWVGGQVAENIT